MFKLAQKTTAVFLTFFLLTFTVQAQTFSDTREHWAKTYIENLFNQEIINGKINGLFEPDAPITRAELVKIAHNAFRDTTALESFHDTATIKTNYGDIKFFFHSDLAPKNTQNFQELAKTGKYNGNIFHRVIDDFMIQAGDIENQNGTGGYSHLGPDTIVEDEFHQSLTHQPGAVSMANAGPNTAGSQFFIVQNKEGTPWLDGRHSVFGQVYQGMSVVDTIAAVERSSYDKPLSEVIINEITIHTNSALDWKPFTDVQPNDWHAPYIQAAKTAGIVDGFQNGEFRPNQNITRAEALKIILQAADVDLAGYETPVFSDTPFDAWYTSHTNYAWSKGLVSGYENNLFKPQAHMTRAEVAKIVNLLQTKLGKNKRIFYGDNQRLELTPLSEDFATDGQSVYYFSDYGFAGIIPQLNLQDLTIPENTTIFVDEINGLQDFLPFISVEHVHDSQNSYLLISSEFFDGKGNLWREAFKMQSPDLEIQQLSEYLTVLTIPNLQQHQIQFLDKHHIKVGSKVYYLNKEIQNVDAATFDPYTNDPNFSWTLIFSHDKNNLYARGELIPGADWQTFQPVPDSSYYYIDKNFVYNYDGEKLPNSDASTFVLVHGAFAKDANNVYDQGKIIPGLDPETVTDSLETTINAFEIL